MYPSPYAVKLVISTFNWLSGVIIYLIYRAKKRENFGILTTSIFLLTYLYLFEFSYWAANDTIPVFFCLLSYYFWIRKNEKLSVVSLIFGGSIKYMPLASVPFLLILLHRTKSKNFIPSVIISIVGIFLSIILPLVLVPGYYEKTQLITGTRMIQSPYNMAFVGYIASTFADNAPLIIGILNAEKLAFIIAYSGSILWYFRRNKNQVVVAYIIPSALLLMIPPWGGIWDNYFIWLMAPLLLIEDKRAIWLYIGFSIPRVFQAIGWHYKTLSTTNIADELLALGGLSLIGLCLCVVVMCIKHWSFESTTYTKDIQSADAIKGILMFSMLQIILIAFEITLWSSRR